MIKNNYKSVAGLLAGGLLLALLISFIPGKRPKSSVDDEWIHYGHDASNNKFSPLSIINTENVSQLKEVWNYQDSKDGSSILFNPLIVKGSMFAFMPSNKLVALNPETGKLIWEFFPDSTDVSTWTRGVTFHPGKNGRPDALLFVFGSTLYSIDASTGKLLKDFGNQGKVDFYTGLSVEPSMKKRVHVTANAPGVIYGDYFIVGCKVPDELPSTSGDIRAFNVNTGKLEWVFHTIPREGEFGYTTWPKNARQKTGGQIAGVAWPWTKNWESFMFRLLRHLLIFTVPTGREKIYLPIVCWLWMRKRVKEYGIFRPHTMICGIGITDLRRILYR
jgi:quinoprotein glucose dehydrogenase